MSRRRFVVSDIHGCARTFNSLLERLELRPTDTLFLLGDYIDRGPDSRGVLNHILDLLDNGYDLRPLRGNHEQLLLDAVDDEEALRVWRGNGGYGTLKEFSVAHPKELPRRYLDFLASLPLLYVLEDYVFVHAGLDFQRENPIAESSPNDLLWARDYRVDVGKLGGRTLVTGHSVSPLFAIEESLVTRHIKLDNGCYSKGEMGASALVALCLDTRELLVVPNCEKGEW